MSMRLMLRSMARLLRMKDLRAQYGVMQDMHSYTRVGFLYAALTSGVLGAVARGGTVEGIGKRLGIRRLDLLGALLRVGVAVGELSVKNGRYRVRGTRAGALLRSENDPLAAMIEEFVTYHSSVYRHLSDRMAGGELGDYLSGTGDLIARSSRVLEPFMEGFVREAASKEGVTRLLEIGCGSGVYIRHAAEANAKLRGIGLDMQEDVIRLAARNLKKWGLGERFKVVLGDIRKPPEVVGGGFDLVTLYNNVYYFPVEERVELFRQIRGLLGPGGRLALLSSMQGLTPLSADFDLILRSTVGCAPLPRLDELKNQLREAGFGEVSIVRLVPVEPFYGVVAS